MTTTCLMPINDEELRIAAAGVVDLPIEQATIWDRFEHTQHHLLWCGTHFLWKEDNKPIALLSLWTYELHGFRYLWARNGPVWLKEASPERELALRKDLRALVRATDSRVVWVRLHAWFKAPDTREPFRMITFDRTVVIDCSGKTPEAIANTMTTEGRRALRRAQKRMTQASARVVEETGLTKQQFHEYFDVLEETGHRDGFHPHPLEYYWDLLDSLGPHHARLFAVRAPIKGEEDRLLCWDLVLLNDRQAWVHYGASRFEARHVLGPDALDFEVACILGAEGVKGVDLMGAHSTRVPQLYSVGRYKRRFARDFTNVAGAWDMPLRGGVFHCLKASYRVLLAWRCLTERRG